MARISTQAVMYTRQIEIENAFSGVSQCSKKAEQTKKNISEHVPGNYKKILENLFESAEVESYKQLNKVFNQKLYDMTDAIDNVSYQLNDFLSYLRKKGYDSSPDACRELFASCEAVFVNIADSLNITNGGLYLFGGSRDDVPPINKQFLKVDINDGDYKKNYYNGNDITEIRKISSTRTIENTVNAGIQPIANTMRVLYELMHNIKGNLDIDWYINTLDEATRDLEEISKDLKVKNSVVEQKNDTLSVRQEVITQLLSDIIFYNQDEVTEAITNFNLYQENIQLSISIANKLREIK